MELRLKSKTLKLALKKLGDDAYILGSGMWKYESLKPDDICDININHLELGMLTTLRDIMKEQGEPSTRRISLLVNALANPSTKKVPNLRTVIPMFESYMKDSNKHWLFSLESDHRAVAYAVLGCMYREADRGYRNEDSVSISLGYNVKLGFNTRNLVLGLSDLGLTVPEILKRRDLMLPDDEMEEQYTKAISKFERYGGKQAEQFWVRNTATVNLGSRESWWERSNEVNLTIRGRPTKAVLDMQTQGRGDSTRPNFMSTTFDATVKIPTHPVLPCFSLAHHKDVWVNVYNMKEYVYEEGLKDRLILPKSHSRLIGALVANLEVLKLESEAEDRSRTIRAKASSSVILAKGPAGTGKTLTAEVYAEEIKRPLYEVASGQLGVDPESIETNLQAILDRSSHLKMPLLINEADVFVQRRGSDLIQNAVCAVFLRLLEYHNGLVFLTTNRADDIDEAIVSRCIAEIGYGIPSGPERRELWLVLLKEFNVELSEKDIDKAVETFPTVVGRDIQNLIRLTSRICVAVGDPFSLKALKANAVFRSIEIHNIAYPNSGN